MNKRFLRWVLDVTHKTEKQYTLCGLSYFTWAEPAIRWNMMFCAVLFSTVFMVALSHESVKTPFLSIIGVGVFDVSLWFLCLNAWYFHRMRRKRLFREALQRTRWMLNTTPYCFVVTILISVLVLVPPFPRDAPREILVIYFVFISLIPYFSTRFWIVIATTPFHTGYGGRPNRER